MIADNHQYGKPWEKVGQGDRSLYFIKIVFILNAITVIILQIPFLCHVSEFE